MRTRNLKLIITALAAFATVSLAIMPHPAAGQAANTANTMTVVVENAPSDLDPASSYDENSNMPFRAFYEGLVTLKGNSLNDWVPVLASKVDDQNNEHKVFTFTLQQGVTFHDGTPFDAAAAKFGIARTVKDALGTQGILGTFLTDPDKMMQVVDPMTLRITFPTPQPFFLIALAASYGTGLVSPTAVKQHIVNDPKTGTPDDAHTWLQTHEAGTGPYTLGGGEMPSADDMNNNGKPLTLKRYDNYWRGWSGSHLQQIVIEVQAESAIRRQMLEKGTADAATVLLPQDIAKLKADNNFQFDQNPTLRVDYLIMGASYGPLANVKARQGMCYAFDYAAYNRSELGGLGSLPYGPFPSTLLGADKSVQPCQTDLKKALELFQEAGIKPGTTFNYAAPEGRGDIAGEILKQQLEQIGFGLNITKYSFNDFNNLLTADITPDRPDLFLNSWWPDYNSPLNYSFPLFYSKSAGANGQNAGYYTDPKVDKIIEQAQQTSDPTAMVALFKQLQQIVTLTDPAGIFIVQSPDRTVVSASIKNQVFNVLYLGTFDFYALSKG
ncbi:MAG: ABC transporter substrate-binding protein [Aggregatilineales bacterium]